MPNNRLIRAITDADLPFELADKSILTELKLKKPNYVGAKELKSSNGILLSENFALCQGVSFLYDGLYDSKEIGALAHNHPQHDPDYTLTGAWTDEESTFEDPKKIFPNINKVLAVHMHHTRHAWPEICVESALKKVGIEKIVHISIKSKKQGSMFWRHMALDVKDGAVYIFPTDFEYGLKYQPKN